MPDTKRTASGVLGGLAGLVGLSAVAGVLVAATVTPAIAVSGAAASSAIDMFDNLPSALEIERLMLPSTLVYTDPDSGKEVELAQFYDQNRSPVEFDEIAPVLYDSILSSEDPRYYQHGGIDLIGTTRALLSNLRGGGETQGGSSISQQYVKNVLVQQCEANAEKDDEAGLTRDEVLANCWTEATTAAGTEGIQRKLQEMRYAISLEQKYSKNDILLGYLNIANFGGTTYGIDAAARYYFGVAASDLSLSQAATLAGMVQNPNTYRIDRPNGSIFDADGNGYNKAADGNIDDIDEAQFGPLRALLNDGTIDEEQYLAAADPYSATKGRQLYVLSRLLGDGKITQDQYVAAVIEPITPNINEPSMGCAPAGGAAYFCQYVKNTILSDEAFGETREDRIKTLQRGGLRVYITMDPRLQANAEATMKEIVPTSLEGWNGEGNAGKLGSTTVSIDNKTGRILSIAQNTTFTEEASLSTNPNYSSLVYAGDKITGDSIGFNVGSTFKLFTLLGWLEAGHSVNESLNGVNRVFPRMTNSCSGDWYNTSNTKIGNFGGVGGFVGTPMRFTASSLNSGYLAMAEQLDMCDIAKIATKMGVTRGDGSAIEMKYANNVIGDDNISPVAMAGAYGTVANNGVYCEPKVIDRVVDADGQERAIPETSCSQVLDPTVAAAAAYALQGVMNGGTGVGANPGNAPVLGKTGTHESYQSWMVESSTNVATAAWVGNSKNQGDIFRAWANGYQVSNMRYALARNNQWLANDLYGGDAFSRDYGDLTRQVLADLPNVVGKSIDEATKILQDAGFQVTVGSPVDATEAEGTIVEQSPGGGQAPGGTMVTISPSNGQGVGLPDVSGQSVEDARNSLNGAGFGNVRAGSCSVDEELDDGQTVVTGTDPAAGSVTNRNTPIRLNFRAPSCD